jgi:hypothetical protein
MSTPLEKFIEARVGEFDQEFGVNQPPSIVSDPLIRAELAKSFLSQSLKNLAKYMVSELVPEEKDVDMMNPNGAKDWERCGFNECRAEVIKRGKEMGG